MITLMGLEDHLTDHFACRGVDDADFEAVEEENDRGSLEISLKTDFLEILLRRGRSRIRHLGSIPSFRRVAPIFALLFKVQTISAGTSETRQLVIAYENTGFRIEWKAL